MTDIKINIAKMIQNKFNAKMWVYLKKETNAMDFDILISSTVSCNGAMTDL